MGPRKSAAWIVPPSHRQYSLSLLIPIAWNESLAPPLLCPPLLFHKQGSACPNQLPHAELD